MPNWFYTDEFGLQQGPVNDAQLKKLAAQQVIRPDTPLETDTGKKGKAGQIKGLFPADPVPVVQTAEAFFPFNDPAMAAMLAEQVSNHPPQVPYYQPQVPNYQYRRPQTGDGKAITSLVCGIISIFFLFGLFILPIIGIIFGILGLKSRRPTMATVGICINATMLLLSLLCLPFFLIGVQAAREAARRTVCANNEYKIGTAFYKYHEAHGALPPLHTVDDKGNPLHSWRVLILPYMGEKNLYGQIRLDEPWDSPHNSQFHNQMPKIYKCPSQPGNQRRDCSYSAIAGGVFSPAKEAGSVTGMKFNDISRDLNKTLVLVEVKETFCWMDPTADLAMDDASLEDKVAYRHRSLENNVPIMYMLFLDCTVQYEVKSDVSSATLQAWASPGGNRPPQRDSVAEARQRTAEIQRMNQERMQQRMEGLQQRRQENPLADMRQRMTGDLPKPSEPPQQENKLEAEQAIRDVFARYKTALQNKRGAEAAESVSQGTINWYSQVLQGVKGYDRQRLQRESLHRRYTILEVRHRISKEALLAMRGGKELFISSVDNGLIGDASKMEKIDIATVSLTGNSATTKMSSDGTELPSGFRFMLEAGRWKVDVTSGFPLMEQAMNELLRQRGGNADQAMFYALEQSSGRKPDESLWIPLQSPVAGTQSNTANTAQQQREEAERRRQETQQRMEQRQQESEQRRQEMRQRSEQNRQEAERRMQEMRQRAEQRQQEMQQQTPQRN